MSLQDTVYTKIITRQIPGYIVYEDAQTIAILDHNPLTRGHCLVMPKDPVDHLDDCSEEQYNTVFQTVQKVSRMLKSKLRPQRIGLVVHGYEIPHAHVHVIPLYGRHDLRFPERADIVASSAELSSVFEELVKGR